MKYIIIISFLAGIALPTSAQITNGRVGYWPFNGKADDMSASGNHGAIIGAMLVDDRFGNPNISVLPQRLSFSKLEWSVGLIQRQRKQLMIFLNRLVIVATNSKHSI
jgi:hypothetical protein